MGRVLTPIYQPIQASSHPVSTTSTGTTNIQTVTVPKDATAVLISVETTNARITLDGTAPGDATGPGVVVATGGTPWLCAYIIPGGSIKVASAATGTSLVTFIWLW